MTITSVCYRGNIQPPPKAQTNLYSFYLKKEDNI